MPSGNLSQVELLVLTALGWGIQDVTPVSVLDTLICLLGYEQSSTYKAGCYEQMHVVRESCRLLIAKAFRGKALANILSSDVSGAKSSAFTGEFAALLVDPSKMNQIGLASRNMAQYPDSCCRPHV